jgi:uncharacterized membrane protein YfcA
MNLELVFIGFVVGALVGLTGVGGGSILTPLLLALRFDPLVAVGTDLLYNVPSKIFGAFLHHRQRTIDWTLVGWLSLGGLPSAVLGSILLMWLRTRVSIAFLSTMTQHAVGFALVLAAVMILATPWLLRKKTAEQHDAAAPRISPLTLVIIGSVVGFVVTITSIGSGSLTLPLLALALPAFGLRTLVGSDIAFSACLVPIALIGRLKTGDVNVAVSINLLVGSLPGILLGSRFCAGLSQRFLRPAVALTLVAVGARLAL